MKIYFYTNNTADSKDVNQTIRYLKRVGITVISNLSNQSEIQIKVDALIVQGKKLDAKSGYLIALMLSQNKDVLCLLPQGAKVDEALRILQDDSNLNKKLYISFYKPHDLQAAVVEFIKILDKDSMRDLANIKYTLRITNKISDYLNWKAKSLDTRKADWLRQEISKMMQQDIKYKKFLASKFNVEK